MRQGVRQDCIFLENHGSHIVMTYWVQNLIVTRGSGWGGGLLLSCSDAEGAAAADTWSAMAASVVLW